MNKNIRWKFKRTLFGKQVLMIKPNIPAGLDFSNHYRYADQDDIIDFMAEIKNMKRYIEIVKKLQTTHPEFFL